MKVRTISYVLIGLATAVVLLSLVGLLANATQRQPLHTTETERVVQAKQSTVQKRDEVPTLPTPQVVVGTPEFYEQPLPRYTIAKGRNRIEPIDLVDTLTGEVTNLQTDNGYAIFGMIDDRYLLWWGAGVMHVRHLETGVDITTIPSTQANPYVPPQIAGDWLAFGYYNQTGTTYTDYTLFAANLATNEIITLTRDMNTPMGSGIDLAFGISERLAAWHVLPNTIVVYDLLNRRELTRITEIQSAFTNYNRPILMITPGETVVTWTMGFGYDLVTKSFFRVDQRIPPDAVVNASLATMSRIYEKDRLLTWSFKANDGEMLNIRAPLLDATPSTELCAAGQNLVQNGDLEATADHALWQQTDSPSNLIVDELPTGLATSGDWAIRLGRYANSHAAIRQPLEIPSGVSGLTLAFDVRALSWDFWGGDRLQVDLIDPMTGNSLLATPVQWTNVELASGDWLPMQVAIESWPGINTPVELVFQVQTDWALPTDFVIDNITLTTACTED